MAASLFGETRLQGDRVLQLWRHDQRWVALLLQDDPGGGFTALADFELDYPDLVSLAGLFGAARLASLVGPGPDRASGGPLRVIEGSKGKRR